MASKTCVFFESGTNAQFEFVLSKYQEALVAKAESKNSKAETLIKLDKWYQTELPKKIKARGKERFLTHDEIVQTIKWKLARGKFRPRLKDLVQMNTPRVVMSETKKAFRALDKKNDIEAAIGALNNLKGVGPAMGSAVLAAGAPDVAPFMADEVLWSMPDIEGIDYTMKEYLKLVEKTRECVERLNSEGGSWTPHKVELAVWTHYICRDLKPELLDGLPGTAAKSSPTKLKPVNGTDQPVVNGAADATGDAPAADDSAAAVVNGDAAAAAVTTTEPEEKKAAESSEQPAPTHSESTNGTAADEPAAINGQAEPEAAAASVNGAVDDETSKESTAPSSADSTNTSDAKETDESAPPAEAAAQTQQQEAAPAAAEPLVSEAEKPEEKQNGIEKAAETTEAAAANGSSDTPTENGVEEAPAPTKTNGAAAAENSSTESNGDSTNETGGTKRSLEDAGDQDESSTAAAEAKRLKPDQPAHQPIPAGGE